MSPLPFWLWRALVVPGASAKAGRKASHRVVFVQTNDLSANHIMVYDRAWDGTLTFDASYATGGKGGMAAGSAADPLASQGSLVRPTDGRLLLAVNAGSDTVSLFRVHGDHLWLQQVIASGGQFPVSIAVHRDLVYVLNAGGAGSVQGYWLWQRPPLADPRARTARSAWATPTRPTSCTRPGRSASPPTAADSSSPPRPAPAPSTSSGSRFRQAEQGAGVQRPGVAGALRLHLRPRGRLVVVEAATATSAPTRINHDNSLTDIGSAADGQVAACWISAARGFYYISNAGSGNLSSFTLNGSGAPVLVDAAAATVEAGVTDSVTTPDQRFLYVECGGAGTLDAFRVHHDGTLTLIQTITGLPVPFEGIALN